MLERRQRDVQRTGKKPEPTGLPNSASGRLAASSCCLLRGMRLAVAYQGRGLTAAFRGLPGTEHGRGYTVTGAMQLGQDMA